MIECTSRRRDHDVHAALQHALDQLPIHDIILHHQHARASRRSGRFGAGLLGSLSLPRPGDDRERHGKDKGRSDPTLRLDFDMPAHQGGQLLADDQTEARSPAPGATAVRLGERLEQPGQLGLRNPDAGILRFIPHHSAALTDRRDGQAQRDASTVGELDGIAQHVRHDLPQAQAVAHHPDGRTGRFFEGQLQSLFDDPGPEEADHFEQFHRRIERLGAQQHLARFHSGEIQNIVDELQQCMPGLPDGLGVIALFDGKRRP